MAISYQTLQQIAATTGLVLCFIAFMIILYKAYNPKAKKQHEEHGKIPFKEDDHNG